MAIIATYSLSELPNRITPLWWQARGLSYTRSGYGKRIPTTRMVQLPGSVVWRRVYVCQYGNAGTAYVLHGEDWIVIRD